MVTYTFGTVTDRGDVRQENQDSIFLAQESVNGCPAAVFGVADGMGGLSYGAQVSQYIASQVLRWWKEEFLPMVRDGMESEDDIRELLEQAVWDMNQDVYRFRKALECRSGSTLSLAVLMGKRFYIANVGDSRVYLYREGRLSRLTRDQSVAEMRGLSEEESKRQGVQNKLTMCIGMFQIPQSIFCSGILKDGDCLLACSDGLYGPLGDDGIGAVLGAGADVSGKVAELRRQIGPGMARDNVSAVAAEIRM